MPQLLLRCRPVLSARVLAPPPRLVSVAYPQGRSLKRLKCGLRTFGLREHLGLTDARANARRHMDEACINLFQFVPVRPAGLAPSHEGSLDRCFQLKALQTEVLRGIRQRCFPVLQQFIVPEPNILLIERDERARPRALIHLSPRPVDVQRNSALPSDRENSNRYLARGGPISLPTDRLWQIACPATLAEA